MNDFERDVEMLGEYLHELLEEEYPREFSLFASYENDLCSYVAEEMYHAYTTRGLVSGVKEYLHELRKRNEHEYQRIAGVLLEIAGD